MSVQVTFIIKFSFVWTFPVIFIEENGIFLVQITQYCFPSSFQHCFVHPCGWDVHSAQEGANISKLFLGANVIHHISLLFAQSFAQRQNAWNRTNPTLIQGRARISQSQFLILILFFNQLCAHNKKGRCPKGAQIPPVQPLQSFLPPKRTELLQVVSICNKGMFRKDH